ncbi:MAG: hypothetical protein ACRDZR_05650 [Acidimicrobiales bacterium]
MDNGAFSYWKAGKQADWSGYYDWAAHWLRHPACDWAVIPDVIGGTETENDDLIEQWPHGDRGVPVWHLDESIDRLVRMAARWPRIALGSAAAFDARSPSKCVNRLRHALRSVSDDDGYPLVKLHGLRMLNPKIVTAVPLASADSTNVAHNIGLDVAWQGPYCPKTRETRTDVLIERIEAHQSPPRMDHRGAGA